MFLTVLRPVVQSKASCLGAGEQSAVPGRRQPRESSGKAPTSGCLSTKRLAPKWTHLKSLVLSVCYH